jgi:immune inhibitor A
VTTFAINAAPATGGAPIQGVTINYGDGSSDDLGSVVSSAQHVYRNDGAFTVTVTATDALGSSATATIVIVVQPFIVAVTATAGGAAGNIFTFTAIVPTGLTVASYAWNFDDTTNNTTTTTSNTAQHTYPVASGAHTVRVTVRTTTNETAQGSITIVVP